MPDASDAGSGNGKTLVIVESGAKADTISRFLDDDYVVSACFGHVRDLPRRAAEAAQREAADVVPALGGNPLDGVGHALHGDAQETGRQPIAVHRLAGLPANFLRELFEALRNHFGIDALESQGTRAWQAVVESSVQGDVLYLVLDQSLEVIAERGYSSGVFGEAFGGESGCLAESGDSRGVGCAGT